MSRKGVIYVAACALIDRDGRILISQRPAGKDHSGLWEFPGGKIEEGERPDQAIIRELREELGVEPCVTCLQPFSFSSYEYEDFYLFMPLFLCRQWDGIAQAREGQKFKWVFPDELLEQQWVPADRDLAKEIYDRLARGRRFE